MIELSSQLVFLIIFLVAIVTVVIGTLVFVARVDRSIANESNQGKARHNEEQAGGKGSTDREEDAGKETTEQKP